MKSTLFSVSEQDEKGRGFNIINGACPFSTEAPESAAGFGCWHLIRMVAVADEGEWECGMASSWAWLALLRCHSE